jgi:hypothetical protein
MSVTLSSERPRIKHIPAKTQAGPARRPGCGEEQPDLAGPSRTKGSRAKRRGPVRKLDRCSNIGPADAPTRLGARCSAMRNDTSNPNERKIGIRPYSGSRPPSAHSADICWPPPTSRPGRSLPERSRMSFASPLPAARLRRFNKHGKRGRVPRAGFTTERLGQGTCTAFGRFQCWC